MESISQTIQFIANLYFRKLRFLNFCCNAHLSLGCQKPNCKYEICPQFLNSLQKYLSRMDMTVLYAIYHFTLIIFVKTHF